MHPKIRKGIALLAGAITLALIAGTQVAFADSPHFVSASASVNSGNQLVVNFKEAGLGSAVTVNYTASADASAIYACINGGDKHPKASNKETVTGTVSGTGQFTSTRAGNITGSVTLSGSPPGPGDFSCPSGQTLVLAAVTFSHISITDTTNNITDNISGTFSECLRQGIGIC